MVTDPTAMGKLCSSRNSRACFVIVQTIEDLHWSDVVGDPDRHFTRASLLPLQSAMRDLCRSPIPGSSAKDRENYCLISDMTTYAIVHNFGPAADDPTKCVRIAGTYTTTDYYWVDQNGHKTYKDSSYSPDGTDVQNDCPYAVDFADFSDDPVVIHPHELFKASLSMNEFLTNSNSPKVRYIKRHEGVVARR